jgi:hypothetical protein
MDAGSLSPFIVPVESRELVAHWQGEGLSVGTIKNRMAVVRRIYERLGKSHMVFENEAYGLDKRPRRAVSRARELTAEALASVASKWADRICLSMN